MLDENKIHWDRITAIIATITAFMSMIVAVVSLYLTSEQNGTQLELTRKHNELSVQPILGFKRVLLNSKGRIGIAVENEGLGPAKIKQMVFGVNKEWFKLQGIEASRKVLRELDIPGSVKISRGTFGKKGRAILNIREIKWLYSSIPTENYKQHKSILKLISNKVNIAICYCSLYGECNSLVLRDPSPPKEIFTCE